MTDVWLYLPDYGQATFVTAPEGDTLTDLQTLTRGWVEVLQAADGTETDVWINEEGRLLPGFGLNPTATALTGVSPMLVGPAVVTGADWGTGDTLPLTKDEYNRWHDLFDEAGLPTVPLTPQEAAELRDALVPVADQYEQDLKEAVDRGFDPHEGVRS